MRYLHSLVLSCLLPLVACGGSSGETVVPGPADAQFETAARDVAASDGGAPDASSPAEAAADAAAEAAGPEPSSGLEAAVPEASGSDALLDAAPAEAGPDPFGCLGQPLPTTAPATVQISGTVVGADQAPIDAVLVEAFVGASTTPAAMTTSAASGTYSLDLTTGGTPIDGNLRASKATFIDTFYYPPVPVTISTNQGTVLLATPGALNTFALLGAVTLDPTRGTLVLAVLDCQGRPITGATVNVQPPGTTRYLRGTVPNTAAMATDATGLAVVFNVPAGSVIVGAASGGRVLRQHALNVRANVLTISGVEP